MGGKETFVLGVEGGSSLGGRQRRGSEGAVSGVHHWFWAALSRRTAEFSEKAGCYSRSTDSRAKAQNPIGSPSAGNVRTAARNGSRTLGSLRGNVFLWD